MILLTVENLVFIGDLLKIQNFINIFENVTVLNTSLTTEFLQRCTLRLSLADSCKRKCRKSSRPKPRIKHLIDSQRLKWKLRLNTEFQHAFRLAICVSDNVIAAVAYVRVGKTCNCSWTRSKRPLSDLKYYYKT